MNTATDLAWSQEEPAVLPEYHRPVHAVSWALLILVLAGAMATGITFFVHHRTYQNETPSSAPTQSTIMPTIDAPRALPQVPDVQPLQPDSHFIDGVREHGIMVLNGHGESDMVLSAHMMCNIASQGFDRTQVRDALMRDNPQLNISDAMFLVNLALNTYCPE